MIKSGAVSSWDSLWLRSKVDSFRAILSSLSVPLSFSSISSGAMLWLLFCCSCGASPSFPNSPSLESGWASSFAAAFSPGFAVASGPLSPSFSASSAVASASFSSPFSWARGSVPSSSPSSSPARVSLALLLEALCLTMKPPLSVLSSRSKVWMMM